MKPQKEKYPVTSAPQMPVLAIGNTEQQQQQQQQSLPSSITPSPQVPPSGTPRSARTPRFSTVEESVLAYAGAAHGQDGRSPSISVLHGASHSLLPRIGSTSPRPLSEDSNPSDPSFKTRRAPSSVFGAADLCIESNVGRSFDWRRWLSPSADELDRTMMWSQAKRTEIRHAIGKISLLYKSQVLENRFTCMISSFRSAFTAISCVILMTVNFGTWEEGVLHDDTGGVWWLPPVYRSISSFICTFSIMFVGAQFERSTISDTLLVCLVVLNLILTIYSRESSTIATVEDHYKLFSVYIVYGVVSATLLNLKFVETLFSMSGIFLNYSYLSFYKHTLEIRHVVQLLLFSSLCCGLLLTKFSEELRSRRLFYALSHTARQPVGESPLNDSDRGGVEEVVDLLLKLKTQIQAEFRYLPAVNRIEEGLDRCVDVLSDTQSLYHSRTKLQDVRDYMGLYSGIYAYTMVTKRKPDIIVRDESAIGSRHSDYDEAISAEDFSEEPPRPSGTQRHSKSAGSELWLCDIKFNLLEKYLCNTELRGQVPAFTVNCYPEYACVRNWTWEIPEIAGMFDLPAQQAPLLAVGWHFVNLARQAGVISCADEELNGFLWCILNVYVNNPYHNSVHGAQVGYAAMWLASYTLGDNISELEKLALCIAGISHDVGHPGKTNGYLTGTQNALATLFNDQSVLEMYHASILFTILSLPEFNICSTLSRTDMFVFRKTVIELILATDMTYHFEHMSDYKARQKSPDFDLAQRHEDRELLLKLLIKGADLSHITFSWNFHQLWSHKLLQEFAAQGDDESNLGLPISPLCDRKSMNRTSLGRSQVVFFNYICEPLYNELADLDQSQTIQSQCIDPLRENLSVWEKDQADLWDWQDILAPVS